MPQFRTAIGRSVLSAVRGPIVVASLVFAAAGARGADFEISPRIELEEAFSDNIDRARDNLRADFITTVRPGVAVQGTGARFEFDLDYSLERLFFLDNSDKNRDRESLLSSGRVEVVEDAIFLDADASFLSQDALRGRIDPRTGQPFVIGDPTVGPTDELSQQQVSTQAAASASEVTAIEDSTSTLRFSVTPSIRHHFGPWADAEARYTISSVSSDTGADTLDTTVSRLLATVNSGRRFSTLIWDLTFDLTSTDQSDGVGSTEYRLVQAELEYAIDPQFSLLASIGHEREEDVTLAGPPDEILWSVGGHVRGARTDLRATYGERLREKILSLDASYEIGPRTTLTASYSRDIQDSEALFRSDLRFLVRDPLGELFDTRTGQPIVQVDSALGQTDEIFKTQRFEAGITRTTDRDTFELDASREIRESDSVGAEQHVLRASFRWNRRLNRRTDASLDLSYRRTDGGAGQVDSLIRIGTDLEYRITEDITGSIIYDRTMRFSDDAQNDFTENVIAARIRGSF